MTRKWDLTCQAMACKLEIEGKTTEELKDELANYFHTPGHIPRQLAVMLIHDLKDLPHEEQEEILDSPNWIAEEKYNGVRMKIHIGDLKNRLDSRYRSTRDYHYVEKTDNVPFLSSLQLDEFAGTILDGELIMSPTMTGDTLTSTVAVTGSLPERAIELQDRFGQCMYVAFDIPYYCNCDIRKLTYKERMAFLDLVIYDDRGDSRFPGTLIRPRCADPVEGKRDFLAQVLQEGGEGIILKHQQGIYVSGKRTREQYKLKKYGTIDCFVTGYVPGEGELTGMVGALKVSVIVKHGAIHEVAAVTPGTLGFRHQISATDGSLKPEWYGKVVSVHFMEWTINNRLRHAVLLGFQEEKTKDDCIIHALGEIK